MCLCCLLTTPSFSSQDPLVPWSVLSFKTYVPEYGDVEVTVTTNYQKAESWDELTKRNWASNPPLIESITVKIGDKLINVPKEAFDEDIPEPQTNSFEIRYIYKNMPDSGGIWLDFYYNSSPIKMEQYRSMARILIHDDKVVVRLIQSSNWSDPKEPKILGKLKMIMR